MFGMKTPDITLAQIIAGIGWVAGQAVATGIMDSDQSKLFTQIGVTVISGAWVIADAIIRQGRAKAAAASALATGAVR